MILKVSRIFFFVLLARGSILARWHEFEEGDHQEHACDFGLLHLHMGMGQG